MKEIHLTVNDASIPGVRYLREMKASTNKRRRDTTYTSKMIERKAIEYCQRYFSICKDIVAYNAGLRLSHRSRIYREPRSSDSITPSFTIRHWSALMHKLELKLIHNLRRRCQWLYYFMILHSFWAGGAAHRFEISTIVNSFKFSPTGNNNPRLHNDLVHILPKKIQKGYDIPKSISRRTVAKPQAIDVAIL